MLSEKQISYVLDELRGYALLRDETHIGMNSQVSCFERIWESDCTLNSTTLSALNEVFKVLKTNKTFAQDTLIVVVVDPTRHQASTS
ncbi:hypothetical protein LENED_004996 [Lentinula edodes]|uniref:Uncharacterized protein n=1 Tax=Lentinula edodes TaxID=5353 RepID=A0A1Q3E7S4_LENED|nr:hypothetical protein LENED_004996 [Lentinula edodes]